MLIATTCSTLGAPGLCARAGGWVETVAWPTDGGYVLEGAMSEAQLTRDATDILMRSHLQGMLSVCTSMPACLSVSSFISASRTGLRTCAHSHGERENQWG